MTYCTEGNIDFYNELNKIDIENEDTMCMLTHQPLSENYITLPCNHKFNYIPLYHEVSTKFINNNYDSDKLYNNEIKCPYCRKKFGKVLPYINYEGVERKNGVNWPEKDCMKHMDCGWAYKTGKNKGHLCSNNAYKKGTECYCYLHWNMIKNQNQTPKMEDVAESLWTNEMETLFKLSHIVALKKILKDKGLNLTGTKKILVRRIINNTKIN
jgi:hypothetical protein